tara:strand:+ start:223 stop:879 length:657 start_codon:yes stop_codon:yes gene_type:complete
MNFYSELGDDRFVFENFFKFRETPGIYLEAYAIDGITNSKTKTFEEIGWTGLLVEPIPDEFEKLKKNRPKNKHANVILSDHTGYVNMTSKYGVVKTQVDTIENIARSSKIKKVDALFLNLQGTSTEYKVVKGIGSLPVGIICLRSSKEPAPQSAIAILLKKRGYRLHQKYHDREIWVGHDLEESYTQKNKKLKVCPKDLAMRILVSLLLIHMLSKIKN